MATEVPLWRLSERLQVWTMASCDQHQPLELAAPLSRFATNVRRARLSADRSQEALAAEVGRIASRSGTTVGASWLIGRRGAA